MREVKHEFNCFRPSGFHAVTIGFGFGFGSVIGSNHLLRSGTRLFTLMSLRPALFKHLLRARWYATTASIDPQHRYEQLVKDKKIRSDDHQQRIIDKLQRLYSQLESYNPPNVPEPKAPSAVSILISQRRCSPMSSVCQPVQQQTNIRYPRTTGPPTEWLVFIRRRRNREINANGPILRHLAHPSH